MRERQPFNPELPTTSHTGVTPPMSEAVLFEQPGHADAHRPDESVQRRLSFLVSWLVAATRPLVTVVLGPRDRTSLMAVCTTLDRIGKDARCVAVALFPTRDGADSTFADLVAECAGHSKVPVEGHQDEEGGLKALAGGPGIGFLHVSLSDLEDDPLPDLAAWCDLLAPGATIVVTSPLPHDSAQLAKARQVLADRYPSACVPLGPAGQAVVAQAPGPSHFDTVEALKSVTPPIGSAGPEAELGDYEDRLPEDVASALIVWSAEAHLYERLRSDHEAVLVTLNAYKDLTSRLMLEVTEARNALVAQSNAARDERARLVGEFMERLDVLTAKISTSAGRFNAELAEKDRLLGEQEGRLLAYAGQAAAARSVIDDMRRSSSWRFTAPLRLVSRMAARTRRARD